MSAHVDTVVRDNLPPRDQWPELTFTLPEPAMDWLLERQDVIERKLARGLSPARRRNKSALNG